MSRRIVHTALLADYRPLLWKGVPVHKRIESIRNVLKEKDGALVHLFTIPLIGDEAAQGKEPAYWLTDVPDLTAAGNYAALSPAEQEQTLLRVKRNIGAVMQLADELKSSPYADQRELGEVLALSVQIPSLDCIYAVGDNTLLACWGFTSRNKENWSFDISRILGQMRDPQEVIQTVATNEPIQPVLPGQDIPAVYSRPPQPPSPPPPTRTTSRKRRWWPLILLLLILLFAGIIALILLTGRKRTAAAALPPLANHYPAFDSTRIITDTTAGVSRKIVGNRLNVKIDPHVGLKDFAEKFKKKYPDDQEVKIVYYDTVAHLIQIEFHVHDIPYWKARLQEWKECTQVYKEAVYGFNNVPSDPGFARQDISYPYAMTGVYNAWNSSTGDSVIVAIIDNGFDLHHPELDSRIYDPFSESFFTSDVSYGIYTVNQHGTHVAALVAGNANNGWGASGFAPGCRFMPIQVSLAGSMTGTHGVIEAIRYAVDHGADVINLSIGSALADKTHKPSYQQQLDMINDPELQAEADAFDQVFLAADKLGCIVVQAAGNDDILAEADPMKRSDHAITVAACDASMNKASFSNYGKAAHVTAPGVNVFSAYPGGQGAMMSGTSMASPIVAGGVALMKSLKKDLTVSQARNILVQTGIPVKFSGYEIGPIVQFDKAIRRLMEGTDVCQAREDSLLAVIDSLRARINNQTSYLLIPPHATDCSFAQGDWYSSNDLFNRNTHENVTLLFRFTSDCEGLLFFVEKDKQYHAKIEMKIENGIFKITQTTQGVCDDCTDSYEKYYFECTPGVDGIAECKAFALQSNQQIINFKLYKN